MTSSAKLDIFLNCKGALMALAYRMVGTLSETEEIVQETYIRWQAADGDATHVDDPKNWLLKVCSRIAIDTLRKSYKSREQYTGVWLPEPVPDSFEVWHESELELAESLSTAFMLILERLKPAERAIYILHDIFGYPFREIAPIVERSEANCRKICERARGFIRDHRPHFDAPDNRDVAQIRAFFDCVKEGDLNKVSSLLCANPEFWSDGGGKVVAMPHVLSDPLRISRFFVGVFKNAQSKNEEVRFEYARINHRHGFIISIRQPDGFWRPETVFSFEFVNQKIARIFTVRNPDKFTAIMGSSDHGLVASKKWNDETLHLN